MYNTGHIKGIEISRGIERYKGNTSGYFWVIHSNSMSYVPSRVAGIGHGTCPEGTHGLGGGENRWISRLIKIQQVRDLTEPEYRT